MNLTIANLSSQIAAQDLQAAIDAINRQVAEHFRPEWNINATLSVVTVSLEDGIAPIQGSGDAIIYLGDQSQDSTTGVSGVYGYHLENHANVPFGFVYLDVCAQYNRAWSLVLSHEVLELLADPTAVLKVSGPAPSGSPGNVNYEFEICDPTEDDNYPIDGVSVSNFVGRKYFGMIGGSGDTNYLKLPLDPFGVRPNGYIQYEDGGEAQTVLGMKITKRQFATKKLMKNGRRNERRKGLLGRTHFETSKQADGRKSARLPAQSLREVLATNPRLRRKAIQAATVAARNVLKSAGVAVKASDLAEAEADIAAASASSRTKRKTKSDVAIGANEAVRIAIGLGF